MKKKSLIIGRNSNLVQSILPLLNNSYELISHTEIGKVNWSVYSNIFVFSWPRSDFDHFLEKINCIPVVQIIFISTSAVLALQRRPQWATYPNEKYRFEQNVLSRGGRVLRIGVTDENHTKYLIGAFPFTSLKVLAHRLDTITEVSEQVLNVFEIRLGEASGWHRLSSKLLENLSLKLPSILQFQIIIHGLAKTLGLKHYGYTSDANFFFRDNIQVGFGALGRHGPKLRKNLDLILVSPFDNLIINDRGFLGTRLGFSSIGLVSLWHGVEMQASSQLGLWRKRVPLWINRSKPPKCLYTSIHVDSIKESIQGADWMVLGRDKYNKNISFWCRKLILAAGPISNSHLLQGLVPVSTKFSDHEIAMVGTVPLDEAEKFKLVRKAGFLMYPEYSRSMRTKCGLRFLIEARPNVPGKHSAPQSNENDFYTDTTSAIIYKLIKKFNLMRLNEAFFNKFGFGFATGNCSLFIQVLVPNTIELEASNSAKEFDKLQRFRLTPLQWQSIQNELAHHMLGFKPDSTVCSVDAQHILGGASLRSSEELENIIRSGRLEILGSPTLSDLDEVHHTCRLQRDVKAASLPLLLYLPLKLNASGCHDEHVAAISAYAKPWRTYISTSLIDGILKIRNCRAVFFQKTALQNIPLALLALLFRIPRILYLHEPLSISQRLQKGVPLLKAVLVSIFQLIEVGIMTRILTGNLHNKTFTGRDLFYAPLLLPQIVETQPAWSSREELILYFGRLDLEKFFDKFHELHIDKTIVATSNLNISNFGGSVTSVSFEEKKKYFQSHRFVWCVQKNSLTQSGVVIDAIKFGCCCIVRKGDPICHKLHRSDYIEIPSDFSVDIIQFAVARYTKTYPNGPISSDTFSKLCGQHAFNQYWHTNLL